MTFQWGRDMQIFISYAHQDRPKVNSLAMQLRQAGIDTWVDSELMGGQVWWDKILGQLRSCDTIIVAVSRYSLSSDACRAERRYAMALGKTVLPLIIEPMGTDLLPPEIARLQVIDYSEPSETAAFQLVGAILKLPPAKPLPEPPPEPPPVPFSYIHELAEQVSLPQLNLDQQLAIIGRLEGACNDPVNRETAISLLRQMSSRQDLYAAPSKRVDSVLGNLGAAPPPHQDPPRQDPPPQYQGSGASGPHPGGWGGTSTGHQQPGTGTPPPQWSHPPNRVPPPPGSSAIRPHWVMAVVSLIMFWPVGIAALVFAAQVRPSLSNQDFAGAQKSSSRVKTMFWVSLGIFLVLFIIIIAAGASSNSNSSGSAAIVGNVIWRQ